MDITVTNMEIEILSKTKLITKAISLLGECFIPICKLHEIDEGQITLCLREALYNAIIHGNLQMDSRMKDESLEKFEKIRENLEMSESGKKKVIIRYHTFPEKIQIEVQDQGKGFDQTKIDFDIVEPYGKGIKLVKCFMDEVTWNDTGNCVRMIKYLNNKKDNN